MSNYLITGGSSEIGQALIEYLISQNHKVIVASRKPKDKCDFYNVPWLDNIDLTKENDLQLLGKFIEEHFDGEFTLIHSVGNFWEHKSITRTSFEEVKEQINSHYVTLFGTMKTVVPIMQKNGGGKIIAFSCNSVKYNYPDMAAFTSCKAAIECLVKCVANEQSKHNIQVNAFALPSIKTKSVMETKPEVYHKEYATLEDLVKCVEDTVENLSPLTNGNIIYLFKYSHSFYHKSYYERNKIWEEK